MKGHHMNLTPALPLFRLGLVILGTALASSACADREDVSVTARRSALTDHTGDLHAELLWNEDVVRQTDVFDVVIAGGPAGPEFMAENQPGGTYFTGDLTPRTYVGTVHAFRCETAPLVSQTFPVPANAVTSVNFGLDLKAGRVSGAVELNGATVAPDATVQVSRACPLAPDGHFFTNYGTTLGDLLGGTKVLPSDGPLEVAVYSDNQSGSFTLNVLAAATTDVGVIHARAGKIEGRVLWNGAPAVFDGVQLLTVTFQNQFAGANDRIQRPPAFGRPSRFAGFSSESIPPDDYDVRVSGTRCASGNDVLGSQTASVTDGVTSTTDVDISGSAGHVTGTFGRGGVRMRATIDLNGGACDSIETNVDGSLDVFLPAGTYSGAVKQFGTSVVLDTIDFVVTAGGTTDLGELHFAALLGNGEACSSGAECTSTSCVDGVCCDTSCGGGDPRDCQACSVSAGAAANGTCGPRAAGLSCGVAPNLCQSPIVCTGGLTCPEPTDVTDCVEADVPACLSSPCAAVTLPGGGSAIDHLTVQFGPPLGAGDMSVTPCQSVVDPTDGYRIVHNTADDLACLDIEVGPTVSYTGGIIVCVYYTDDILDDGMGGTLNESLFELYHDDGHGWLKVTTTRTPGENKLCGLVTSLSPFAIVAPKDTTPPVLSGVPVAPLTIYATSAAGAKVTYGPVRAVDAVDGALPAPCTRASGTTFPLGTTNVTCTATDRSGSVAKRSFTVSVKVQAPTDGTFFLQPINPDGSSIFKRGSTIPVKFRLTGASAGIKNLVAKLANAKVSNGITGTFVEAASTCGADSGNTFRYEGGQYVFNLSTRSLATGTWSLKVDLGDGVVHAVNVSLK
jgi:hypothetical protein